MGFFSDLIDLTPNRTVAHEIKDYCSNTLLNAKEIELIRNSNINEQQFIWLRNSRNYCVFRAFINSMNNRYPNTYWKITQPILDTISSEVFYSKWRVSLFEELDVPLPSTYGLWEHYFDEFCSRIENKSKVKLPDYVIEQLKELTNEYQAEIARMIKARINKLNKPI